MFADDEAGFAVRIGPEVEWCGDEEQQRMSFRALGLLVLAAHDDHGWADRFAALEAQMSN